MDWKRIETRFECFRIHKKNCLSIIRGSRKWFVELSSISLKNGITYLVFSPNTTVPNQQNSNIFIIQFQINIPIFVFWFYIIKDDDCHYGFSCRIRCFNFSLFLWSFPSLRSALRLRINNEKSKSFTEILKKKKKFKSTSQNRQWNHLSTKLFTYIWNCHYYFMLDRDFEFCFHSFFGICFAQDVNINFTTQHFFSSMAISYGWQKFFFYFSISSLNINTFFRNSLLKLRNQSSGQAG